MNNSYRMGTGSGGAYWLSQPFAVVLLLAMPLCTGCGSSEIRPVELFPEDNCAQCRMVISDERCASEIIDEHGDVFKFDDISCLLSYRSKHGDIKIIASFLKDYESKQWLPYEKALIVETGAETPMGSGKIAFADSKRAIAFQKQHPRVTSAGKPDKCCE